jgi:two-component system alkaline phosphatase synthesis response regulator PhoP
VQKTILVVDDERDIVELVKYNLVKEGYNVLTARNGEEALEKVKSKPDLILLDVMMPQMDGHEVVRRLKRNVATANIPLIFLTAKGMELDEVVGLELGAEDYIVKPISMARLLVRVKAVFRRERTRAADHQPEELQVGEVEIFPARYEIKIGKKLIHLPKKEFETLLFLAQRPQRIVTRKQLLDSVWGEGVFVVDRTVDVHIRKIREKLGELADYLETIKGVGYRFRVPE